MVGGVALLLMGLVPPGYGIIAICLFVTHLMADALDGPLARFAKCDGPSGALIDIMCDQMAIIAIALALYIYTSVNGLAIILFVSTYLTFIFGMVIANMIGIRMVNFVRTKYPLILMTLFVVHAKSMLGGQRELAESLMSKTLFLCAAYYGVMAVVLMRAANDHVEVGEHTVETATSEDCTCRGSRTEGEKAEG